MESITTDKGGQLYTSNIQYEKLVGDLVKMPKRGILTPDSLFLEVFLLSWLSLQMLSIWAPWAQRNINENLYSKFEKKKKSNENDTFTHCKVSSLDFFVFARTPLSSHVDQAF